MFKTPLILFYTIAEREARPFMAKSGVNLSDLCSDFAGIGVIGFLENPKCILLIIGDYA